MKLNFRSLYKFCTEYQFQKIELEKKIKQANNNVGPLIDLYNKRFLRLGLEKTLLDKKKILVPAKRLRQEQDTLLSLRSKGETAGVILSRDEFDDVDIVLDQRQIYSLKRRPSASVQSFYIQYGREEVRCVFDSVMDDNMDQWVILAKFRRYIVGRPNKLFIPLIMRTNFDNKYLNKGSEYLFKYKGIWVNSYKDDYPIKFEIDPANVTPKRGYKLGDLYNSLPNGIELHPQHLKSLNDNLLIIGEDRTVLIEEELKKEHLRKQLAAGTLDIDDFDMDLQQEDEDGQPKQVVKKEKKVRKTRSLKKQIAEMGLKVREDLGGKVVAATGKK